MMKIIIARRTGLAGAGSNHLLLALPTTSGCEPAPNCTRLGGQQVAPVQVGHKELEGRAANGSDAISRARRVDSNKWPGQ